MVEIHGARTLSKGTTGEGLLKKDPLQIFLGIDNDPPSTFQTKSNHPSYFDRAFFQIGNKLTSDLFSNFASEGF